MTPLPHPRASRGGGPLPGFLCLLLSSVGAAPSALAQTAEPAPEATNPEVIRLERFEVSTTFQESLAASAEFKRTNPGIVESINAIDIGKLPDVSIAESIARLPGLAAQRVAGRAQVISVRGLSPDFATTLLNGREQVSTGDNRGVEFDQYPSELINNVDIYKTPDARLVSQGLSGTINLRTVDPLARSRRVVAVNARYEINSLDDLGSDSENDGYRLSATYIDQFMDNKVGLALGYARLESPIAAQEFGNYNWNRNDRTGLGAPAGVWGTDGLKVYARSGTNTRDGAIGVLSFRPTPEFTSVIDGYYSQFKREETARGHETHIGGYNGSSTVQSRYTATDVRNGNLLGGTITGVYPLVRNIYNDREDTLTAIGWFNEYRTDVWTFVADLSYSHAERDELNLETQAQLLDAAGQPVYDTARYSQAGDEFPTASFTQAYTDPARLPVGPTIYGAGYGKVPQVEDELMSYKVSAKRVFDAFVESAEVGFNFADRSKDKAQPEASLSATRAPIRAGLLSPTNLEFANTPSTLSWSVPTVLAANYDRFEPSSTAFGYLIPKTWLVEEQISTIYGQLNLKRDLGNVKFSGNVGVQVKAVDQSSRSNYWDSSRPAGQNLRVNDDGATYTDVLPSANLTFDFGENRLLRLAGAKQVARPRLDHLKSALELGIDTVTGKPGGSGGNPRLDPWEATAFDISLEKYFADYKGYVVVAGFYKDLETYIYEQTNPNYDFSELIAGNPLARTNIGDFRQPLNGEGGSLKGFEIVVSIPFGYFFEPLEGLGVYASYAYNDSEITVDNTNLGSNISLPGLSETVYNVTVFYERAGFSSRISLRDRSDFIGEISGFGADRELRFVKGEGIIDAQIGYEFGGRLKGLGLLLQAYNLANTPYETYQDVEDRVVEYQEYGRTFLIGASYRF